MSEICWGKKLVNWRFVFYVGLIYNDKAERLINMFLMLCYCVNDNNKISGYSPFIDCNFMWLLQNFPQVEANEISARLVDSSTFTKEHRTMHTRSITNKISSMVCFSILRSCSMRFSFELLTRQHYRVSTIFLSAIFYLRL